MPPRCGHCIAVVVVDTHVVQCNWDMDAVRAMVDIDDESLCSMAILAGFTTREKMRQISASDLHIWFQKARCQVFAERVRQIGKETPAVAPTPTLGVLFAYQYVTVRQGWFVAMPSP